jgi:hypothetical protein
MFLVNEDRWWTACPTCGKEGWASYDIDGGRAHIREDLPADDPDVQAYGPLHRFIRCEVPDCANGVKVV